VSKLFAAREPMLFKERFRTCQQGRPGPKTAPQLTVPWIRLPGRGYLGRSEKQWFCGRLAFLGTISRDNLPLLGQLLLLL